MRAITASSKSVYRCLPGTPTVLHTRAPKWSAARIFAAISEQVYPWAIVLSPSGHIFWLWPRASLSVNSCAICANPAAHPLLKAHTSRMTRKAPSSTDDGLVWFEVRAQRACGKVAKTIPNWRVRETLLLVVLLVHVFGTKDGYSYPSGYPAHIWHEG